MNLTLISLSLRENRKYIHKKILEPREDCEQQHIQRGAELSDTRTVISLGIVHGGSKIRAASLYAGDEEAPKHAQKPNPALFNSMTGDPTRKHCPDFDAPLRTRAVQ